MRKHDDYCPCCGEKMEDIEIIPLTPEAERMLAEMGEEGWLPIFDKDGKRLFKVTTKKIGR
jgi:hypothetical protein